MAQKNTLLLKKMPTWLALSPYGMGVCALVLTACVVMYSLHSGQKERDATVRLMQEKGEALLFAVQGSLQARRNGQWLGGELQDLLERVGAQKNILYLGILDDCNLRDQNPMMAAQSLNSFIAANDSAKGLASTEELTTFLNSDLVKKLNPTREPQYSIQKTPSGASIFLVYKTVAIDYDSHGRKHRHGRGRGMGGMRGWGAMGANDGAAAGNGEQVLMVAYDMAPVEEAAAADQRHNAIMVAILVFLGLVGLLSLYFVRQYHISRSRVAEANALLLRQERLAALGTMAAGVAHEVRNPLSSISGAARIIQEAHPEGSEENVLAQLIGQEVTRLDKVVGDLLDVSRQDSVQIGKISLEACVLKARYMLEADMEAQQVHFSMDIVPQNLIVYLDQDRMSQVLLNLFLNALQAMPQGGQLKVAARLQAGEERGGLGPMLVIHVADTGVGISPDKLDKIFSPYFTSKAQGTGLGLSIVHKIVEAHGGRISVQSRLGEGTDFCIQLPQGKPQQESTGI